MNPELQKFSVSLDALKAEKDRIEKESQRGGDIQWFQLDDGQAAMIRVLPIIDSATGAKLSKEVHRYRPTREHKLISPYIHSGVEDSAYQAAEYIKACCSAARKSVEAKYKEGDPIFDKVYAETKTLWSQANAIRPKAEHWMLVLVYPMYGRAGVQPEQDLATFEGPKLFRTSPETHLKFLNTFSSPLYATQPVMDFELGRRVYIKRTGKELDTTYDITLEPTPSAFPKAADGNYRLDLISDAPDLDTIFKPASGEEVAAMVNSLGYLDLVNGLAGRLKALVEGQHAVPTPVAPTPPPMPPVAPGIPPTMPPPPPVPVSPVSSVPPPPAPMSVPAPPVAPPIAPAPTSAPPPTAHNPSAADAALADLQASIGALKS